MLVDQVTFCVAGLGFCTTIGVKVPKGAQLYGYLARSLMKFWSSSNWLDATLEQPSRHLAPLFADEDLGTGFLL